MMGEFKPWHIAVLVLVLVVLFGAKRLPTAARSLGQSMRILKAETKGLHEDDAAAAHRDSAAAATPAARVIDRGSAVPVDPKPFTGDDQPVATPVRP